MKEDEDFKEEVKELIDLVFRVDRGRNGIKRRW